MSWSSSGQPLVVAARHSLLISEPLHLAYLSYYGIILVPPAILFAARRDVEFSEALFVLVDTFVVCFVTYIAFPVTGRAK